MFHVIINLWNIHDKYDCICYNVREWNASILTVLRFTDVDHVRMDWLAMEQFVLILMNATWQIHVINKLRVTIPFQDSGNVW